MGKRGVEGTEGGMRGHHGHDVGIAGTGRAGGGMGASCVGAEAGAGPRVWPWPRGRGRGTVPLLQIGGDLGRDSRKRNRQLLADGDGAKHVLRPCGSRRGHGAVDALGTPL